MKKFLQKVVTVLVYGFGTVAVFAFIVAIGAAAWSITFGVHTGSYCSGESPNLEVVKDNGNGAPDNLWNIAQRRFPDTDYRRVGDEIQEMNNLSNAQLQPGKRLRMPAYCG